MSMPDRRKIESCRRVQSWGWGGFKDSNYNTISIHWNASWWSVGQWLGVWVGWFVGWLVLPFYGDVVKYLRSSSNTERGNRSNAQKFIKKEQMREQRKDCEMYLGFIFGGGFQLCLRINIIIIVKYNNEVDFSYSNLILFIFFWVRGEQNFLQLSCRVLRRARFNLLNTKYAYILLSAIKQKQKEYTSLNSLCCCMSSSSSSPPVVNYIWVY